jgi:hypothetical protein
MRLPAGVVTGTEYARERGTNRFTILWLLIASTYLYLNLFVLSAGTGSRHL